MSINMFYPRLNVFSCRLFEKRSHNASRDQSPSQSGRLLKLLMVISIVFIQPTNYLSLSFDSRNRSPNLHKTDHLHQFWMEDTATNSSPNPPYSSPTPSPSPMDKSQSRWTSNLTSKTPRAKTYLCPGASDRTSQRWVFLLSSHYLTIRLEYANCKTAKPG